MLVMQTLWSCRLTCGICGFDSQTKISTLMKIQKDFCELRQIRRWRYPLQKNHSWFRMLDPLIPNPLHNISYHSSPSITLSCHRPWTISHTKLTSSKGCLHIFASSHITGSSSHISSVEFRRSCVQERTPSTVVGLNESPWSSSAWRYWSRTMRWDPLSTQNKGGPVGELSGRENGVVLCFKFLRRWVVFRVQSGAKTLWDIRAI